MIKSQCQGFLSTPPIWTGHRFDMQQFEFPTTDFDLFQPQPIPQNLRLGHQMEYVFKQLVDASKRYDITLYNLQIRNDEKTLGEIDFILFDHFTTKSIHVELTCKFYIIDPDIVEPVQQLIGPNRRDSFVAKLNKIKNVQYALLHSEAGISALDEVGLDHRDIEHQCCFKAQIFEPFHQRNISIEPINPACISGYWLRLNDIKTSYFADAQFYLPTKSEWVITPHAKVNWQSQSEVLPDIDKALNAKKAPIVWMKKADLTFEKFFMVWW